MSLLIKIKPRRVRTYYIRRSSDPCWQRVFGEWMSLLHGGQNIENILEPATKKAPKKAAIDNILRRPLRRLIRSPLLGRLSSNPSLILYLISPHLCPCFFWKILFTSHAEPCKLEVTGGAEYVPEVWLWVGVNGVSMWKACERVVALTWGVVWTESRVGQSINVCRGAVS